MPSGEPIEELILQDVETTLAAIVSGADYYTDVRRVYRFDVGMLEAQEFPCIAIAPSGTSFDNPRSRVVNTVAGSMRLAITLGINVETDLVKLVSRFVRDVHKALYLDITRGGYALNTRVVETDPFYPLLDDDPLAGAEITVEIDYRTIRSDLNTTQT